MRLIPMVCIAMLLAAIFALELGSTNKGVAFVPAVAGPTKVRPDDLIQPIPRVVSLEEADQRYNRQHRHQLRIDDSSYHDECWLNNCDLELELKLAKVIVTNLFIEQP